MSRLETMRGTVVGLEEVSPELIRARVFVVGEERERRVVAYPPLTGPLAVGDVVLLNTTATGLGLGTGGVDFVMAVAGETSKGVFGMPDGSEHIIKLRYTPHQHAVRAAELTDAWPREATRLDGVPVVVGLLHSQLAPAAAALRAACPTARLAYVMTDSAALPLAFSNLVRQLRAARLLDVTLTAGQAFGGDHECVTLPSALLAARHLAHADAILVLPGPGNAGTGTPYGFSGVEQGPILDTVAALGGSPIALLRFSDADARTRHQGLSHHSVHALSLCARRHTAAVPAGFPDALTAAQVLDAELVVADGGPGLALLAERDVRITSMGRTVENDPVFFHAAAAAGAVAAQKNAPGRAAEGEGVLKPT